MEGVVDPTRAVKSVPGHFQPSPDLLAWTEHQLVASAQRGCRSAFDELFMRYKGVVYGTARHYADSCDEAEDLVQETMLRAFRNIERFRGQARFSSWLVAIAVNAGISAKRKAGRAKWVYLDDPRKAEAIGVASVLADRQATPEQVCIRREHKRLLADKIRQLQPKYRGVLQRMDLAGSSIHATACSLGITDSAAKSRLYRARHMLTDALQTYTTKKFVRKDAAHPLESLHRRSRFL
jgi:RNA polymerase sigma-70 factor (ECF subfamily)